VPLGDDLARIAASASAFGEVGGVLAAEAVGGARTYLVAFAGEPAAWVVLDDAGEPVRRRETIRDAASIVAVCELAEETAGGGQLDELRQQLVQLRLTEHPDGIEDAEAAASSSSGRSGRRRGSPRRRSSTPSAPRRGTWSRRSARPAARRSRRR
jgi:hypothetical protein